jgi:hypothetical protein
MGATMQQRTCPRCGVVIPDDAQWEPLDLVDGRAPAYRHRHEKPGGKAGDRKCVVYSGEGAQAKGPGEVTRPLLLSPTN